MLKIRKRDGTEAIFDRAKIKTAIQKANLSVSKAERLSDADIGAIAQNIEDDFLDANCGICAGQGRHGDYAARSIPSRQ